MTSQSQATIRLHIAPLNPELLPLVLPPSVRSLATDVSFHNIPTFPENNYGYVTLPEMEADKVKKKLNGSILKGRKFKVESARPQKRKSAGKEEENTVSNDKSSSDKKLKKRKAEATVLEGYELPSDRKVKRGWTESSNDKTERRKKEKRSKDKEKRSKAQLKSKYTEKEECLFRTKIPPNKSGSTDEKSKKHTKKSKAPPNTVVHEFSQTTTHPTFLRSNDGGSTLTSAFEDGKGWVDESGAVREPASERVRKDQYRPGQVIGHKEKPKHTNTKPNHNGIEPKQTELAESEDWTSSSGSSSELDMTDSEDDASVSSSSSKNSEESSMESPPTQLHKLSEPDGSEEEQESGAEPETSFEEKFTSANIHQQPTGDVHPLEALFKKPADQKKPESEPPAQFSFFGQEDADSEEESPGNIVPLTPFTKRDLQDRGTRSAAPTPDTSKVTRTINWNPPKDSDNIGEEYLATDSPVPKSAASSQKDSDFAKWFWENRGDNNRAWKKRRRDAAKEHRQRENRRKGMKGKS